MSATAPSLHWYFDVISPFAWLQWPRVRALAARRDVALVPILFAAVLQARGQKGPAEIPGKREFTYRHALWRARRAGQPLVFPPAHPFNPLHALRLLCAAGATTDAVDAVMGWIWAEGHAADSAAAIAAIAERLGLPPDAAASNAAKDALRRNTDDALAVGVFGVPTLALGGALFWGEDAHDFALAALDDPALLDDAEMRRVASLPIGIARTR